ncbi:MAG: malonyl-ACP O-methyltransferase BioC [Rhodocyclaceae bacterium]
MHRLPAKQRIRASFDRAAASYDGAAVLQRQVCEQLLAGLTELPADSAPAILDAGCGTGYGARLLRSRWPAARLTLADFAPAMLKLARGTADACLAADIEALPCRAQSFDLWWSSLSIQWCDAAAVFAEAARILRPHGRLAVSTLGPGTFNELRSAFDAVDRYRHTLPFSEAAAIEAALRAAGFHGIALRRATLRTHYPDLKTLLRAVKAIGANPLGAGARSGMMGRSAWQALEAAYEKQRTPDGLPASYDVIVAYAER